MSISNFIVSTTPVLDGYQVKSYLGAINTNIVIGTNFFSDFAASFTDVFGGNSGTYQRKMDAMYDSAQKELIKKARRLGGNAILGFRIDFDEISGKGKSMFMLSATGTACVVDIDAHASKPFEGSFIVDQNLLQSEVLKDKIISKIKDNDVSFSDDEWNYMAETPSKDVVTLLVNTAYYQVCSETKLKIETLLNQIDYSDAVEIVYPIYMSQLEVNKRLFDPNCFDPKEKVDVSGIYEKVIKNCSLFEPENICKLVDKDLYKAVAILESEKPYYTPQDLKAMEDICTKLDNLPDAGKIEKSKGGLFSKEGKDYYYCRHGHKNDNNVEFCYDCDENIKGLTRKQAEIINNFKRRTEILAKIIKEQQ